jgi:hypothetical protein
MNTLGKRTAFLYLAIGSVFFAGFRALANVGGGSGVAITPYAYPGEVTAEQMTEERKIAGQNRFVEVPLKSNHDSRFLRAMCFVYGWEDHPTGAVLYNFHGKDSSGTLQTIDMSDVLRFAIVSYRGDECLVKVTVFPWISIDELLRQKPSYSDLQLRYTHEVELWVKTKSADGPLLVCEIRQDGSRIVACPFTEILPKTNIRLEYAGEHIWYAIQSVIDDPAYPYRVIASQ